MIRTGYKKGGCNWAHRCALAGMVNVVVRAQDIRPLIDMGGEYHTGNRQSLSFRLILPYLMIKLTSELVGRQGPGRMSPVFETETPNVPEEGLLCGVFIF